MLVYKWAHLAWQDSIVAWRFPHWVRPLMSFSPPVARIVPSSTIKAIREEVAQSVPSSFLYVLQPVYAGSSAAGSPTTYGGQP